MTILYFVTDKEDQGCGCANSLQSIVTLDRLAQDSLHSDRESHLRYSTADNCDVTTVIADSHT
jgi:hypothetical protein